MNARLFLLRRKEEVIPNAEQLDALSIEESEKLISDYITAATIKDCSIMATLCPIQR